MSRLNYIAQLIQGDTWVAVTNYSNWSEQLQPKYHDVNCGHMKEFRYTVYSLRLDNWKQTTFAEMLQALTPESRIALDYLDREAPVYYAEAGPVCLKRGCGLLLALDHTSREGYCGWCGWNEKI